MARHALRFPICPKKWVAHHGSASRSQPRSKGVYIYGFNLEIWMCEMTWVDALIVWRWMSGGGVTTLVSGHSLASLASKQLVFSSLPQSPTTLGVLPLSQTLIVQILQSIHPQILQSTRPQKLEINWGSVSIMTIVSYPS